MGAMCKMIQAEQILLDISVADKTECIKRLISALEGSGALADAGVLLDDVLTREKLSTTALGSGCAVPHAHSDGVKRTVIAAARLETPVDFSAEDGESVKLVFLMAGPKQNTGLHLKVLSKLARLLHDSSIREELMKVQEPGAFYAQLCPEGG
jgi:fructose-specific phosphotransferase system IIA component